MTYDIVIVGGGVVGAGLAIALQDLPLQIALVDAKLPDNNDPRLFALNHSSFQFLANIGLWSDLQYDASAIKQVHVSNKGRFGAVRLNAKEVNLPVLGYVVPAKNIELALNRSIEKIKNVTLYRPATLTSLVQQGHSVNLKLNTDKGEIELSAKAVIGADGATSTVRQQTGIAVEQINYHQSAIVTRVTLQGSHQHIAYERFTQDGAIAMLPLAENECASIWTTDTEKAKKLMAMPENSFIDSLQSEFGYRLGRLQNIGERYTFPLHMFKAKQNTAGSVFLLGNAAHTLHPIAAQGFNLALHEVATLVECIKEIIDQHRQLEIKALIAMQKQIYQQQAISVGVSHRLSAIFTKQSFWMTALLQLGMIGFDSFPRGKKQFIEKMLGKTKNLPRLLMENTG